MDKSEEPKKWWGFDFDMLGDRHTHLVKKYPKIAYLIFLLLLTGTTIIGVTIALLALGGGVLFLDEIWEAIKSLTDAGTDEYR